MPYKDPILNKQKAHERWHTWAAAHPNEKAKRNARNQTYVISYLLTHPCVDCGEADPVVLTFDHRDPKEKKQNVSLMIANGYALNTLIAEIKKCDVRCANCHRRKTAKQFGWWK
jgi:hypothetical protein